MLSQATLRVAMSNAGVDFANHWALRPNGKGVDSSSTTASCVGSNHTGAICMATPPCVISTQSLDTFPIGLGRVFDWTLCTSGIRGGFKLKVPWVQSTQVSFAWLSHSARGVLRFDC